MLNTTYNVRIDKEQITLECPYTFIPGCNARF